MKPTILTVEVDIHVEHPKMRFPRWANKTKQNWIDDMETTFQNASWKDLNTQYNWNKGELNFDARFILPPEKKFEDVSAEWNSAHVDKNAQPYMYTIRSLASRLLLYYSRNKIYGYRLHVEYFRPGEKEILVDLRNPKDDDWRRGSENDDDPTPKTPTPPSQKTPTPFILASGKIGNPMNFHQLWETIHPNINFVITPQGTAIKFEAFVDGINIKDYPPGHVGQAFITNRGNEKYTLDAIDVPEEIQKKGYGTAIMQKVNYPAAKDGGASVPISSPL